jgi:hypothetical protein
VFKSGQFANGSPNANLWTFRQVAARAVLMEKERAPAAGHRYRNVVVDEAQDLSPAHWMLLRALVPLGPDDMFLAGDTHRRIYDSYVLAGQPRNSDTRALDQADPQLPSTHEILAVAEGLLGGEEWDDLDAEATAWTGIGPCSPGPRPQFRAASSWHSEMAGILQQVKEWLRPLLPRVLPA